MERKQTKRLSAREQKDASYFVYVLLSVKASALQELAPLIRLILQVAAIS